FEKCRATAGTLDLVAKGFLINIGYIGPLICSEDELTQPLDQVSVAVLCAQSGVGQSVSDVNDAYWKNIYRDCFEGTRSELAVPVIGAGKVLAVVNLESTELNHFTPQHQARAEKYATLVASYLLANPGVV